MGAVQKSKLLNRGDYEVDLNLRLIVFFGKKLDQIVKVLLFQRGAIFEQKQNFVLLLDVRLLQKLHRRLQLHFY